MKRSPLRSKAKKRPGLILARLECRERAGGLCEIATPLCPAGLHQGAQAHHRLRRSQGGQDTPENLMWLCNGAHTHVHAHPAESFEKGWLLRRTEQ